MFKYIQWTIISFFFMIRLLPAIEYDFNKVKRISYRYLQNDRYDKATEVITLYIDNKPYDYRGYIELAEIYKRQNRIHKAKRVFLKGLDTITNNKIKLNYPLGKLYYSIGEYNEEINNFKIVIEKATPEEVKTEYNDVYKLMAISYLLKSEHNKAIKYFHNALEIDLTDDEIYNHLSSIYLKLNDHDYKDAYRDLGNLVLNNKGMKMDKFKNKSAQIFFKYGKYEDASSSFMEIYSELNRDHKLHYNIGLSYFFQDNYSEAIRFIGRAIKLYNERFSMKRIVSKALGLDKRGAKYFLTISLAYYLSNHYNKAKQSYEEIKKHDSSIYKRYKNISHGKNSNLYRELKESLDY